MSDFPRPPADGAVPPDEAAPGSAALARFRSCRWSATGGEQPDHCTHRDVLPLAGIGGFNPDAWCADCQYFKLRRVRKR